jgi:hypothetical protein
MPTDGEAGFGVEEVIGGALSVLGVHNCCGIS